MEKWSKLVDDWKISGLSQAEFCRRNGINSNTFSKWKNRFFAAESPKIKEGSFVEIPFKISKNTTGDIGISIHPDGSIEIKIRR